MTQTAASIGWLDAFWLGLVEGITEFLPISSTGHLIVAERALGLPQTALTIGIQLGAISAILALYWRRLLAAALQFGGKGAPVGGHNLLVQILVAALPAALLGLWLDDWIEDRLFSAEFVAGALFVGGLLLLWVERMVAARTTRDSTLADMSYATAFWIGCFQCLALLPGTSRSGATIAGALLLGLSRTAAAEFSFLVGLPILYGACGLKVLQGLEELRGPLFWPFVIATATAFVSALLVVRPFVAFLRRSTFAPFAAYRLVAGVVLGWLCWTGRL